MEKTKSGDAARSEYVSALPLMTAVYRLKELAKTPRHADSPAPVEVTITQVAGSTYRFRIQRGLGVFARLNGTLQAAGSGTRVIYTVTAFQAVGLAIFLLVMGLGAALLVTRRFELIPVFIMICPMILVPLLTIFRVDVIRVLKTTLPPETEAAVNDV